ncbi:MAG TPA: hypothetical protein VM487_11605 [Phycisphaerae bacterium]|nr:hypothetical protein [Dehalococcoidia bacterium]HUU96377.1 hypothetical protein [Phycisphaerae bacterium]
MTYVNVYDLRDYEGLRELGGIVVRDGATWAMVDFRNVPAAARDVMNGRLVAYLQTLANKTVVTDLGADRLKARWTWLTPPAVWTDAEIAHLEGEAAACVGYVRWSGPG